MLLEELQEAVDYVRARSSSKPNVGVVLGSGLGAFANELNIEIEIPYSEIPHFSPPTVEGHSGKLIIGDINGKTVAVMQGRNHYYEGHSMDKVAFPTRVLAMLGIEKIVLTNAAGSIKKENPAGSFLVITDHINFMGNNPLMGPNVQKLGPRFPDMSEAYDRGLNETLIGCLKKHNAVFSTGVYCAMSGPTYETPAEIRMLEILGGSAVGMSTVPEVIAANHLGLRVATLSCLTNLAAGVSANPLSHDEVTETAKESEFVFCNVIKDFVEEISA
ncbi:MAG: purine-nucleoside phosphorylase [Bdellovibrionales bacterium]